MAGIPRAAPWSRLGAGHADHSPRDGMSRTPRPSSAASSLPAEILLVSVSVARPARWSPALLGRIVPRTGHRLGPPGARARGSHAARRSRRRPRRPGLLVGVAAMQLWVHYPHTTRYGLPGRATLEALSDDFRRAWDVIATSQVPVAAQTGLVIAARRRSLGWSRSSPTGARSGSACVVRLWSLQASSS